MPADLKRMRTDVPFMVRRRSKKTSQSTDSVSTTPNRALSLTAKSSPSPSSSGLSLGRKKVTRPSQTVPRIRARDSIGLRLEQPVVRLSRLQSAIGSMVVEQAERIVWESQDFRTGIIDNVSSLNAEKVPSRSNRKVVEFSKERAVVGLRQFKSLRRVVFVSQKDMVVSLYDGAKITIPTDSGKNVLLLSVIQDEIELRLEFVNLDDPVAAFGFVL